MSTVVLREPIAAKPKFVYVYGCVKHEKLGKLIRVMPDAERAALQEFAAKFQDLHLDSCWTRGCQDKCDRVVLVRVHIERAP